MNWNIDEQVLILSLKFYKKSQSLTRKKKEKRANFTAQTQSFRLL
jgi:hypothetical protein